jgi:hypothetical protein
MMNCHCASCHALISHLAILPTEGFKLASEAGLAAAKAKVLTGVSNGTVFPIQEKL